MSELIWCWRKGNTKVYTKSFKVAEQAMNDGFFVMVVREKPLIVKYTNN